MHLPLPQIEKGNTFNEFDRGLQLVHDGLNPQLRQLVGTIVTSGNLEEIIELVKKAMVYGEDKGGSSEAKTKNKQKWLSGEKGGKGNKAKWGPSGEPKGKVQRISGDS